MKLGTKSLIYPLLFLCNLQSVAAKENFAESPSWLAVAHYQKSGKGYVSTIDSDPFFLSSEGKRNPQAELDATVALFKSGDDKIKCLFPARYKLLEREGIIKDDFPYCEEWEQFYKDLNPAGVTLLFTDAYMSNPSSLFGHTLLRVDTGRKGTQLLAHGANFGAFTEGKENSALFAIMGLTGGYYGGFTIKPYYDVINTYNNIENRDIWEFNLDFTPEERDFFVAHLWELGHNQSRYYFFTRNCSYMIMETLDAVRPSLQLASKFSVQTIPLDTMKAVYHTPGLVKDVNYRPSRQAKINHRYRLMSVKQKENFLKAVKEENYVMEELPEKEQADVLEAAYQFEQYQYVAEKSELADYRRKSFKILAERNKLKNQGNIAELEEGKAPYLSHEAMRATLGGGVRNGEGFQELSYRPAYHSLTDDSYGFLRGAEINFLNTIVRHYDSGKTVLQQFDLLGIKSLSPVNSMFTPISYKIEAGIERVMNPDNEREGYEAYLTVGGGAGLALSEQMWVYSMGNSHAAYGGFLPHNQWSGFGIESGIYGDFDEWRILASVEKIFASAKFADRLIYKAEAAYTLSTNWALAASAKYENTVKHGVEENIISLRHYF